jgi:hypothetical protein
MQLQQSTTIDLPALCLRANLGSINVEARTVELTFSTGAGVMRYDYRTGTRYLEKLSLDPKHVRLDRLNVGAPLLNTHSAWSLEDQIGVVVDGSAMADGKRGRALVRFSKRDAVEPIWQDVRERIVRNVSTGYAVYKYEETTARGNELPVRLAIDWEPYEISMVPMPADFGAQTRGGDKALTYPCVIVTRDYSVEDADRWRRLRLATASLSL